MKKLLILLISLFTVLGASAYAADVSGTYEGWYYASQGQTGTTLTLNPDGTGVFEFYSMPGKSNSKAGSYSVTYTEDGGSVTVIGNEWINQPSGYIFVSLYGTLDGDIYSGKVNNRSWEFRMIKNNDSYTAVTESVLGSHRYEVFNERLYWEDAENYCEGLGGHLVTVNSAEEQAFIEALLKGMPDGAYMIGTHRKLDSFNSWVTGEALTYTNWAPSQPDNLTGKQEVGVIAKGGADKFKIRDCEWDDTEDSQLPFICEWDGWANAAQWSTPELQRAADNKLIPDVLIGKDMTAPITRGEFAAVSVKLFEAMTGGKAVMSSECDFADISYNENRNYILKAFNIGAINGYSDTVFAPDAFLQREQLAAMLTRVYKRAEWPDWSLQTDEQYTINYSGVKKFDDDALISDYAKPSVYFLVKYGVLSGIGDNKFAPKNSTPAEEAAGYANATREQALVMSLRSFDKLK